MLILILLLCRYYYYHDTTSTNTTTTVERCQVYGLEFRGILPLFLIGTSCLLFPAASTPNVGHGEPRLHSISGYKAAEA